MLKNYTDNIDTNIYLAAAEELGYEVEVIDKESSFAKIRHNGKFLSIYENCLSINNQVSGYFSTDKYLSGKVLQKAVPQIIPETLRVSNKDADAVNKVAEFAKAHQFSIVIKPNNASLGIGVSTLPADEAAVRQISTLLLKEYEFILAQQYISGKKEYRVVYVQGKFFDALERIPAFVVGDGLSTITQLVEEKNKFRIEYGFPLLFIDEATQLILAKSDLTADSVLKSEERLTVKGVCNFAQGGETLRIPVDKIHPDFLSTFTTIAQVSDLQFIGIDLIADSINNALASQSAGVNEINSAPMSDVHYFCDLKQNTPLASTKRLLEQIFLS